MTDDTIKTNDTIETIETNEANEANDPSHTLLSFPAPGRLLEPLELPPPPVGVIDAVTLGFLAGEGMRFQRLHALPAVFPMDRPDAMQDAIKRLAPIVRRGPTSLPLFGEEDMLPYARLLGTLFGRVVEVRPVFPARPGDVVLVVWYEPPMGWDAYGPHNVAPLPELPTACALLRLVEWHPTDASPNGRRGLRLLDH